MKGIKRDFLFQARKESKEYNSSVLEIYNFCQHKIIHKIYKLEEFTIYFSAKCDNKMASSILQYVNEQMTRVNTSLAKTFTYKYWKY